jgi:hypothetical protein
MKTTEVFVEQVIIGVLLLFTSALLISEDLFTSIVNLDLGGTIMLLGGVYLLGIVYDRFADTLLQDLEQHHRLRFAFKQIKHKSEGEAKPPAEDPFPENELRIRILEGKLSDQASYLRSRIRLTRALTSLTPAMTVGCLMMLLNQDGDSSPRRLVVAITMVVVYALAYVIKVSGNEPPKTYDLIDGKKYQEYKKKIQGTSNSGGLLRFIMRHERLSWLVLLLTAGSIIIAILDRRPSLTVIPIVGLLLTMLFGWSWWRISKTFMTLLIDYDRFGDKHS